MAPPTMRPRRVGEILDAAIKLYLGNARVLIGSAAAIVVPLQIISGVVLASTYTNGSDISTGIQLNGTVTPAQTSARLGATGINELFSLLGSAFVLAACVKALSDGYLGQETSVSGSLRFGLRRLLPLIGLAIIYFIGQVIGFILLIIPGIWLYGAWSVRVPALVIEGTGPFRALGRSYELVKGRWWPTAGVLIVSTVMVGVIGAAIGAGLIAISIANGTPSLLFAVVITTLIGIVSGVLLQPFQAAVTTVLYYDLRIRHEGYDLELLADQLGLPTSDLPAGGWTGRDVADGTDGGLGHGGGVGRGGGFDGPPRPEDVGQPGGPPFWPPPPGWQRGY